MNITETLDWEDIAPEADVAIWEKYEYLIAAWWGNHTRAVDETVVRMHTTHREVERVLEERFAYEYDHGTRTLGDA